jgi:hypothetical protein
VRYGIVGDDVEQRVDALSKGAEHLQYHSLSPVDVCEFNATLVRMLQALLWMDLPREGFPQARRETVTDKDTEFMTSKAWRGRTSR